MAYNQNVADNEKYKFRESTTAPGTPVVAVGNADGSPLNGGSIFQLPYDYVSAAYPDDTTEVYTTRIGGSGGSVQEVVTVTYTDNTKEQFNDLERI